MTWTREQILDLLEKNDHAVERAIVAIYNLQTEDEKRTETTRKQNGVGFRSTDARRGSYYAKWVMDSKRLTGHHLGIARKIAKRYVRQLVWLANNK